MNSKDKPLTPEEIAQMFRDFGLETDEQRQSVLRYAKSDAQDKPSNEQLFIRIDSNTEPLTDK